MKRIVCFLVFLLTVLMSNAQSTKGRNNVEVNIKIYQRYDTNNALVCSSVGVVVVNNIGKKIYIPDLRAYMSPFIYKKVGGEYSERQNKGIIIIEEYVNPNPNGTPPKRNDDFDPEYDSRGKKIITNNISDIINEKCKVNSEQKLKNFELARDSASVSNSKKLQIVKPYIDNNIFKIKHMPEYIGFLKPNEVVESSYSIVDIDNLKDTKGDYKIFVDVVAIKKILETKRMFYSYPAEFYHDVMGYELFLPENMTFNVVYITIL
jgi:hypothetical protein